MYTALLITGFAGYSQTVLNFNYDVSGNQTLRHEGTNNRESVVADSIIDSKIPLIELSIEEIENQFSVSPNPTSGQVVLRWEPEFNEQIISIELVSLISSETTEIPQNKGNTITLDLSGKITGLYLVNFYLKNTTVPRVQKKIIKL